ALRCSVFGSRSSGNAFDLGGLLQTPVFGAWEMRSISEVFSEHRTPNTGVWEMRSISEVFSEHRTPNTAHRSAATHSRRPTYTVLPRAMINIKAATVGTTINRDRSCSSTASVSATWLLAAIPRESGRPRSQLAAFMSMSRLVGAICWRTLSAIVAQENSTSL